MTAVEVASHLQARRTGPARWRARCPAHEDRYPSLDITEGNDGRTLMICRAGCSTLEVLREVGLSWSDLFPERESPHRLSPFDLQANLRRRAEQTLRHWAEHIGKRLRDEVYARHRAITVAEELLATSDERGRGWELLAIAYNGLPEREWLLDLLDSRRPSDWLSARRYLEEK